MRCGLIRGPLQRTLRPCGTQRHVALGVAILSSSSCACRRHRMGSVRSIAVERTDTQSMVIPQRQMWLDRLLRRPSPKVKLEDVVYDTESTRYRGTAFGMSADNLVFYGKVIITAAVVILIFYVFFRGYVLLSRFSLQTIARLGFAGGFASCFLLYSLVLTVARRVQINANAVYNQSIAMAMRNDTVQRFLGPHPRTGSFKTYSVTGGFKLPLARRLRSGSYELADLLGLKQRRLQMLFVLKNPVNGREGLVACDVRKESTGFLKSTNVFHSLSVTLTDSTTDAKPETVIIVGRPEDVIQRTLIQ